MPVDKNSNHVSAAKDLKDLVQKEVTHAKPANLDDLIELLDADDLRNVVGMLRPKGRE
jgi:hypothetical protein